jgi:hypothetical protein
LHLVSAARGASGASDISIASVLFLSLISFAAEPWTTRWPSLTIPWENQKRKENVPAGRLSFAARLFLAFVGLRSCGLNFGFVGGRATMSASAAGISYSSVASLQSGVVSVRGHGGACCCPARSSSAVRLGSGRNLCPPRFRAQKVTSSSVKCGARVRNTLTTDVYQQDEHDIAQSRKEEHESGIDLKQWMHEQGLPECKVALAEHRPWEGDKGRSIHYIVASQDLQVTEILVSSACTYLRFAVCHTLQ